MMGKTMLIVIVENMWVRAVGKLDNINNMKFIFSNLLYISSMESPSQRVENNDILRDQPLTPRNKVQNSILSYASNPKREVTVLGSSFNQQNKKVSQKKGEFVISYNFDYNTGGRAITHNILIGWDDQPTKKSVKKSKPLLIGCVNPKAPINRMINANKIISEEQKKQNNQQQTKRINSVKKKDKNATKFPIFKRTTQHSYISQREDSSNQAKSKQTYVPAIDRKVNNDKQLNNLQNNRIIDKNHPSYTLKPILNPIEATQRKNQSSQPHNQKKNSIKKQQKINNQNKLKFPSFQTSKQDEIQSKSRRAPKHRQNNLGYKNGRTIQKQQLKNNNVEHKNPNPNLKNHQISTNNDKKPKIFNSADSMLWKEDQQKTKSMIQKSINDNNGDQGQYGADTMKLIQELQKMESQNTQQNEPNISNPNQLNKTQPQNKIIAKINQKKYQANEDHSLTKDQNLQQHKKLIKSPSEYINKENYNKQSQTNKQKLSKQRLENQKYLLKSVTKQKGKKQKNQQNQLQSKKLDEKQIHSKRQQNTLEKNNKQNKNQGNFKQKKYIQKVKQTKQINNAKNIGNKRQQIKPKQIKPSKQTSHILQNQVIIQKSNEDLKENYNLKHINQKDNRSQRRSHQEKHDNVYQTNNQNIKMSDQRLNKLPSNQKVFQKEQVLIKNGQQLNKSTNILKQQEIQRQQKLQIENQSNVLQINEQTNKKSVAKKSINSYAINLQQIKNQISKPQNNRVSQSDSQNLQKNAYTNLIAQNTKTNRRQSELYDSKRNILQKDKFDGAKPATMNKQHKTKNMNNAQLDQIKELSNKNKQQNENNIIIQKQNFQSKQQKKLQAMNKKNLKNGQNIFQEQKKQKLGIKNIQDKNSEINNQNIKKQLQIKQHQKAQSKVQINQGQIVKQKVLSNNKQLKKQQIKIKQSNDVSSKVEEKQRKNQQSLNQINRQNFLKPYSNTKHQKISKSKIKSQPVVNSRQSSSQTNRTKKQENNMHIKNNKQNIDKILNNQTVINKNDKDQRSKDQQSQDKVDQNISINLRKPNTGSSLSTNRNNYNKSKQQIIQNGRHHKNSNYLKKKSVNSNIQKQAKKLEAHCKQPKNQGIEENKKFKKNSSNKNKDKQINARNQSSESDSDLFDTSRILNSEAPKQITCISKKSSVLSHRSSMNNVNNNLAQDKSNKSSNSIKSQIKAINIRQFKTIGIQIGEGSINTPIQGIINKINVSVGTSVREILQTKNDAKQQLNQKNIRQQQNSQQIKDILKKNREQQEHNGLVSELVSFGNITCSPKLQPTQKQSFLNIQQNQKLNHTDFPQSIPSKQRKLNKKNSQCHKKDRSLYKRAPILDFIYGDQRKLVQQQSANFKKSEELCPFQFCQGYEQDDNDAICKAIKIIIGIDSWLIDRILEPYSNINGDHFIWLYCKGHWKLFQSNNSISANSFIRESICKAILLEYGLIDPNKLGIEQIIRMVTGLRVMQLKNKKKLSQEIEYHLKKGNILKGISNKFKNCVMYNILGVETTAGLEKLLQIQKISEQQQQQNFNNDDRKIIWIKQETFQKYFDYFLLICYREQSRWTCKQLNNNELTRTLVYTLDSLQNSIGSLQLHSNSQLTCKIDLYRQVKPKLLKFIGSLNQKNKPARSTQNPNSSICFNFSIKGRYYVLINLSQISESNTDSISFSLECSEQVTINYLESIQHETYKNSTSQYIEINNKNLSKSQHRQNKQKSMGKIKDKSILSQHTNKQDLREQFINYLMNNDDTKFVASS